MLEEAAEAGVYGGAVAAALVGLGRGEGFEAEREVDAFFAAEPEGLIDVADRDLVVVELAGEGEGIELELAGKVVVVTIADQSCLVVKDLGAENRADFAKLFEGRVVAPAGVQEKRIATLEVGVVI